MARVVLVFYRLSPGLKRLLGVPPCSGTIPDDDDDEDDEEGRIKLKLNNELNICPPRPRGGAEYPAVHVNS